MICCRSLRATSMAGHARVWHSSEMRIVAALILGTVAVVSGCRASQDDLLARAPIDLSCPKAQLQTRKIGGTTGHGEMVIVEGCGRRQTYVAVCNGHDLGSTCTWVRDGAATAIPESG
jgi:hypothetical protein